MTVKATRFRLTMRPRMFGSALNCERQRRIAEDHHGRGALGPAVAFTEATTQYGLAFEHREVVAGDHIALHQASCFGAERGLDGRESGEARQHLVLLLILLEFGVGKEALCAGHVAVHIAVENLVDADHAIGIVNRNGPEGKCIQHRKDAGVDANAKCDRADDDDGEAGRFAQGSDA